MTSCTEILAQAHIVKPRGIQSVNAWIADERGHCAPTLKVSQQDHDWLRLSSQARPLLWKAQAS